MGTPLTPKPTRKSDALGRAPSTIVSRHKEDVTLKEVTNPRLCNLCYVNDIFETKTKDGITVVKVPDPRTNPRTKEAPTAPKPHTRPSHPQTPRPSTPSSSQVLTKPVQPNSPLSRALIELIEFIMNQSEFMLFIMNRESES